jgi:L-arabinose isomerase
MGLDKNAVVKWQSFPNPVKDRLYFHSENGQQLQLSLVDLSGRVIFVQTIDTAADEVDLSNLASGAYLIKFSNAQGALLHTAKLVKE